MTQDEQRARHSFDSAMSGVGRDVFLESYWSRRFGHFPGSVDRFAGLFDWEDLNQILRNQGFDSARLRMYRDGKAIDSRQYLTQGHARMRLKPASLLNLLADGATLILDSVQDVAPSVGDLARSFEEVLQADTVVNLYAAWSTRHGFDLHWDEQDTTILQLAGHKRWQVFAPTREHPLAGEADKPSRPAGDPIWEGTLSPGDVLYLPRGWWHAVLPVGEPTLHLTVTTVPACGIDLLSWLVERLQKRHAVVRRNIPLLDSAVTRAAYLARLREALDAEWTGDLLEEFLTDWRAAIPPAPDMGLPSSPAIAGAGLQPGSRVRLAASRTIPLSRQGNELSFRVNGVDWQCSDAFGPALQALSDRQAFTVESLLGHVAPAQAQSFLTFLTALQMGGVVWTHEPAD